MANHRGMPAALIRPTAMPTPPEANGETNGEPLEDPADGEGQGRGEANGSARRAPKRRSKPAVGEKSSAHKLTLPDSVFTRLELTAIKRGSTASAIAAEILERNLPRLRIAVDD
jgi:hypothetical protein